MLPMTILLTLIAAPQHPDAQPGRPEAVEVGSRPEYQFREPLLNGRGVRSLVDLRGRPTLIEFWGTR